MAPSSLQFLRSQVALKLPYPDHQFTGQTIIVTGSNTGLGLEAARHFVRLNATKVILAVRNLPKGEGAKQSIDASEKRPEVTEVWDLDLSSYASVKAFAKRAQELERLDVLLENAGVYTRNFRLVEDNETSITVNVVSTFLLGLLLLPKLRATSVKLGKECILTFTSSFVHSITQFPERKNEKIFEALAVEKGARMMDRYNVSKMVELLCGQELASAVATSPKKDVAENVTVSLINPGYVATDIIRESNVVSSVLLGVLSKLLSRTSEVGARTLVHGAEGGQEKHGQYLDDCRVGETSAWVRSEDGRETAKRVWKELLEKLEGIQPGISANL